MGKGKIMDNSRKYFTATFLIAVLSIPTIANAALVGRLAATEGGSDYQAYYDTEADLTWLANANYAFTSGYINTISTTYGDGTMDWVTGLSVGGVGDWRLPETIDVNNDGHTYTNYYQGVDAGYNITTHSEMSNLYFNVLGNDAWRDVNGNQTDCATQNNNCLTSTGPFSNIQSTDYWSSTEFATNADEAWKFSMNIGDQVGNNSKSFGYYAWAVHDGDVAELSSVPIPSAVWLFGSGLIGLLGLAKRKKINRKFS